MKSFAYAAEIAAAILIGLLTIPMLLLGTLIGIRGSIRYLRIKSI